MLSEINLQKMNDNQIAAYHKKISFKIVNIAKENKIDTIVIGKNDHYQGGRLD